MNKRNRIKLFYWNKFGEFQTALSRLTDEFKDVEVKELKVDTSNQRVDFAMVTYTEEA